MIESPLIQEIVEEAELRATVSAIINVLQGRFDTVPPTITAGLEQIKEIEHLARLTRQMVRCKTLEAFEKALCNELSQRLPPSIRGKPCKPAQ